MHSTVCSALVASCPTSVLNHTQPETLALETGCR